MLPAVGFTSKLHGRRASALDTSCQVDFPGLGVIGYHHSWHNVATDAKTLPSAPGMLWSSVRSNLLLVNMKDVNCWQCQLGMRHSLSAFVVIVGVPSRATRSNHIALLAAVLDLLALTE